MILILTNAGDRLQSHVLAALESRGSEYFRFNTEDFPQRVELRLAFGSGASSGSLRFHGGRHIDLAEIDTVWFRRPMAPVPDERLSAEDREFVLHESTHALTGLCHYLADCFWINPYAPGKAAEFKPYQLEVAAGLGLRVPRTLITNQTEEVVQFFEQCGQGMIYKTLTRFSREQDGKAHAVFTSRVNREQLDTQLAGVSFAPCIFQENIAKRRELRATVIGSRIFVSAIDSQSSSRTSVDWRRGSHIKLPPQTPFTFPSLVEEQVRAVVRELGLVFGCVDLIETPDGEIVFLEVNPNGEWFWVERGTGMPLVDCFADLLTDGHRRRRELQSVNQADAE